MDYIYICDEKWKEIFEITFRRRNNGEYILHVSDYRSKGKQFKDNIVGKSVKIRKKEYWYELSHLDRVCIYSNIEKSTDGYVWYLFDNGRLREIWYFAIPIIRKVFLISAEVNFCYDNADNTLIKIEYKVKGEVYKKECYEKNKMVKRVVYPEKIDNKKLKLIYKILKNKRG